MPFKNLTPYTLTVAGVSIPSDADKFAKIEIERDAKTTEEIDGLPVICAGKFRGVAPLPPQEPGTVYVVSAIVAQAVAACHPERGDFVALGEQAQPGNPSAGHLNLQRF